MRSLITIIEVCLSRGLTCPFFFSMLIVRYCAITFLCVDSRTLQTLIDGSLRTMRRLLIFAGIARIARVAAVRCRTSSAFGRNQDASAADADAYSPRMFYIRSLHEDTTSELFDRSRFRISRYSATVLRSIFVQQNGRKRSRGWETLASADSLRLPLDVYSAQLTFGQDDELELSGRVQFRCVRCVQSADTRSATVQRGRHCF